MTSPLHSKFEQAYAEFAKQQSGVSEFERKLAEASTTVTAKNRAVIVTVDGQGDLTELKFPTNAYRTMAPAELSSLLVETIKSAREQARESASELLHAHLPAGGLAFDMLDNPVDFDEILTEAVRAAGRMFPDAPQATERTDGPR